LRNKPVIPAVLAAAAVILVVASSSLASGARSSSSTAAAANPNLKGQSVSVITTEGALDTVVMYHAEDLLRSWGADVKVTEAGSTSVAVAGAVSGQADIADISPLAGYSAVVNGLDMKVFAVAAPRTDDVFVANSSIATMKDMKGKKVGVLSLNSVNGIETGVALAQGGLKIPDVSVVLAGGQSVRVGALIAGRIDGGPISLDNFRDALQSHGFHILYNYMSQSPRLIHDVLWASPKWISGHQQMAVAYNRALLQSFRWASNPANKPAFVKLATSKLAGVDANQAGSAYDDYLKYHFYPVNDILTNATMSGNESNFSLYNLIPKALPVSDWVDSSYAKKALALEKLIKPTVKKK
jgi:ABC-type nitrate/sulfonate/bicarbonate transport system substrate-binding protein